MCLKGRAKLTGMVQYGAGQVGWLPVEFQCLHMQKWWLAHRIVIMRKLHGRDSVSVSGLSSVTV